MTGRTWELTLPYLRPPLSANRRKHWSPAHREYKAVKSDITYLAKHWQQAHGFLELGRADVELLWFPGSNRLADGDNQTDSIKPILDGMVAAGVWPDDNWRYVRRSSAQVVPRIEDPLDRATATVILKVTEVEDGRSRDGDEHPGSRRRPRPPERDSADCPHCPRQSVPPERRRRSAPARPR